jgi:CheY-like chemotaxis protein
VSANSEGVGKGSEFVIRLPLAVESTDQRFSSAPIDLSALPKRKVLIVEDNLDVAQATEALLLSEGQQTRIAGDGASALAVAAQFKPEIAIIDIGLPDIDGYEVSRRLREILPKIVLVALSGWPADPRNPRSRQAGFKYYFVKPLAHEQLKRLLAEIQ